MKDIRPLLLILLSVGLVATWIYHFYDKTQYGPSAKMTLTGGQSSLDSSKINSIRDSLHGLYAETIENLDSRVVRFRNSNDSLHLQLSDRIAEIHVLRTEIGRLLKNPNTTAEELRQARRKIEELEEMVEDLKDQNRSMEAERASLLDRLDKASTDVNRLESTMTRLEEENKQLNDKVKQASVFMASALHFAAVDSKDDKDVPTAQAKKADKLVGSFVLQNNLDKVMNAEVFVIVTEPDGHTLQNSSWDSGTFLTKQGARKNYTRKVRFDYDKGEQKRLLFSFDMPIVKTGKYALQVWHDGLLIGEANEVLR